jgi:hypothetical protein
MQFINASRALKFNPIPRAFKQIPHNRKTNVAPNSVGIEGADRATRELLGDQHNGPNCVVEKEHAARHDDMAE